MSVDIVIGPIFEASIAFFAIHGPKVIINPIPTSKIGKSTCRTTIFGSIFLIWNESTQSQIPKTTKAPPNTIRFGESFG